MATLQQDLIRQYQQRIFLARDDPADLRQALKDAIQLPDPLLQQVFAMQVVGDFDYFVLFSGRVKTKCVFSLPRKVLQCNAPRTEDEILQKDTFYTLLGPFRYNPLLDLSKADLLKEMNEDKYSMMHYEDCRVFLCEPTVCGTFYLHAVTGKKVKGPGPDVLTCAREYEGYFNTNEMNTTECYIGRYWYHEPNHVWYGVDNADLENEGNEEE